MKRSELSTTTGRGSVWDFMNEMERTFEDLWGGSVSQKSSLGYAPGFSPPVDLHETEDFYLLSFDLPGVPESEIRVEVHDGRLTVSGERKSEREEKEGGIRRFEKSYGRFERTFQLPPQIDENKVQARSENGVLEVMIPKGQLAKPRSIQVESGKSGGGLFSKLMNRKDAAPAEKPSKEERH